MANTNLETIRRKIRLVTRAVSTDQITDAELNEYINTFLLYDMPEHLRLFNFDRTFTFYTNPYQDVYSTNTTLSTDPLYQFKQAVITVNSPIFIGGYEGYMTQDRTEFFGKWPPVQNRLQKHTGDGVTTQFSGTISQVPITPGTVTFSSLDSSNVGLVLKDVPVVDGTTGTPFPQGNLYIPNTEPTDPPTAVLAANNIDYVTGAYTITFTTTPASSKAVYVHFQSQQISRPVTVLYYNNSFTFRPVPDDVYPVSVEAYVRPSELLDGSNEQPSLQQHWQYIAYGAAIKYAQDRTNQETVNRLLPEYQNQEELVLNRTLVQRSNQRAATIYSDQTSMQSAPGSGWWWNGY